MKTLRLCSALALLALSGAAAAQAGAQGTLYGVHGFAWKPTYEVLATRPSYRLDCVGPCDMGRGSGSVYVGGMFSRYFGAQVGYLQWNEAERAEGINLSLVGRAPVFGGLGVYGRLGTTWGRSQRPPGGAGLSLGGTGGWGPAYGMGLDWAFTDRWSAVLDWQRHRLDYAGEDAGWMRSTSIGLKYRF